MRNAPPIRVLIADGHPLIREGFISLVNLQTDMTVVGEASNGREAIDLFRQYKPDAVLMDVRMPELSGVEATKAVTAEFADARIIAITTLDVVGGAAMIEAGAIICLLKDCPSLELLTAIRTACLSSN